MQNFRCFPKACLLVSAIALALSGCKLEIRVPQGGTVVSSDGAYVCAAGQTCIIDIVDLFFDETFVAMPAQGYYFSRWKDKDGYLCGGDSTPCKLATAQFEGHPALLTFLESDETFFLEPRFVWSPVCPPEELVISPAPSAGD